MILEQRNKNRKKFRRESISEKRNRTMKEKKGKEEQEAKDVLQKEVIFAALLSLRNSVYLSLCLSHRERR